MAYLTPTLGLGLAQNLIDDLPPMIEVDAGRNDPDLAQHGGDALFAALFAFWGSQM